MRMRHTVWLAVVMVTLLGASASADSPAEAQTICQRVWTEIKRRDVQADARGLDIVCNYSKRPTRYWQCVDAKLKVTEDWTQAYTACADIYD